MRDAGPWEKERLFGMPGYGLLHDLRDALSEEGVGFFLAALRFDPMSRLSAGRALAHPFLRHRIVGFRVPVEGLDLGI